MGSEPLNPDRESHEFSLVLGGPLYQLWRRTKLVRSPMELLHRRIIAFIVVTWLPLAVLSIMAGTFASGVKVPFLYDLTTLHFVIVLPILIAAELVVHRRMREIVEEFLERELIAPADLPQFKSLIHRAIRLRNSVVVEVLLLVLSLTGGNWAWRNYASLHASTWYATAVDGASQLNAAGYWLAFVSLSIVRFIVFRWYFRLFNWYLFLWRVSRLKLRLNPLHPDRAGGLGFLEHTVTAFAPVLMAQSCLLAATIGNRILHSGDLLPDFKLEILGVVVSLMVLVLLPLTFFAIQMVEAKFVASREYGGLASRYANNFRQKWLVEGKAPDESLLGTGDIQSLADLANSFAVVHEMRPVPFDRHLIVRLASLIALPLLPLVLTMIPFEELLDRLLQLFLFQGAEH